MRGDKYEAIPQAQIGFRWDLPSMNLPATTVAPGSQPAWNMASLEVASDAMYGFHQGESAHADFMSGWSKEEITQLLKDCYWTAYSPDPAHPNPRNCGHIGNP